MQSQSHSLQTDTPPGTLRQSTQIIRYEDSRATYVKCNSRDSFVMPDEEVRHENVHYSDAEVEKEKKIEDESTQEALADQAQNSTKSRKLSAKEVNETLNLNLGLSVDPENPTLRKIFNFISKLLELVEQYGIMLWIAIPLRFRHHLAMVAWKCYFRVHRRLLGNSTGIHVNASDEYHALTSIMWWGNLFPVTLNRIRFALNQLQVVHIPSWALKSRSRILSSPLPTESKIEETRTQEPRSHMKKVFRQDEKLGDVLVGYYIQICEKKVSEKAIFWIYGGAYLGGDCEGNVGIAEEIGKRCNSDVFLANIRLLPEFEYIDAVNDVCNAYDYFLSNYDYKPLNVKLLGISSGGGLAVRLLQSLKKSDDGRSKKMPAGAVLMCPFVDYTEPKGTFKEYYKHDLIVNRSVCEMGIPYLQIKLGSDENRLNASPVYGSFNGLPPLCVVISEHECVYDQVIMLVNNARRSGVDCTVGVWKYMCHVFSMLSPFIPEGKQSWDFMCDWINSH